MLFASLFSACILKLGHKVFVGQQPNTSSFNPIALRKAKIVYNFGLSECNRDKQQEDG